MNVLIFGANGYIGKHLTRLLATKKSINILASDIHNNSFFEEKIEYIQIDLSNKTKVENIDFSNFDIIYFLSGVTGTKDSFKDYNKYIEVNQVGLLNLLSIISQQKKKPLIIFPSTRLVYKGRKEELNEDSEKAFKTIYGLSKFSGEEYLKMYNNLFQVPFIVVRICVPYGNLFLDDYSYGTIGFFIYQASSNKRILIYGDGTQKRTFSHINDICNQIFELTKLKESINNIYNISGETMSIKEAANLIASKYRAKIDYLPWPSDDLKLESGDTIFNSSKIENLLNYNLNYNFHSWLNDLNRKELK